jgi:hypothetical protein
MLLRQGKSFELKNKQDLPTSNSHLFRHAIFCRNRFLANGKWMLESPS